MIKINRAHDESLELDVLTLKEVNLEGISFHRCLLNDLDFSGSTLVNIDFRSAEMNNAKFVAFGLVELYYLYAIFHITDNSVKGNVYSLAKISNM